MRGFHATFEKDVSMKKLLPLAVLAALSSVHVASAQAADVSAAVGATGQSGMTYRLGLSWDWDKSWWQTSTGRLTGYWDAGYTYGKVAMKAPASIRCRSLRYSSMSSPATRSSHSSRPVSAWRRSPAPVSATRTWVPPELRRPHRRRPEVRQRPVGRHSGDPLFQRRPETAERRYRVLQPVLQDPDLVGTVEKSRVHPGFSCLRFFHHAAPPHGKSEPFGGRR